MISMRVCLNIHSRSAAAVCVAFETAFALQALIIPSTDMGHLRHSVDSIFDLGMYISKSIQVIACHRSNMSWCCCK
jgi:hypothetical protein